MKSKEDTKRLREISARLKELGIPEETLLKLNDWIDSQAYNGGVSDLQLAELCSFADKLDASGNTVYAIQFSEYLEELSVETGLSIPVIKNMSREYRKRR